MKEPKKPRSLAEMLLPKEPRMNYIEPNFVPMSAKVLMGGAAKTGKSFCSMELARALATGTPAFHSDQFPVTSPVKVLLADKELGEYSLDQRAAHFFRDTPSELLELAVANFHTQATDPLFKLDADDCQEHIKNVLDELQPNVLIIDPVSKFMEGSDQDNDHVRSFLEFCDVLIDLYKGTTKLSIVMTHHFKKPAHDWQGTEIDPLSAYNFRGGSRWYDDMDSLVTMKRHDISADRWKIQCQAEFRHGKSPDDFWLEICPASDLPVKLYEAPRPTGQLRGRVTRQFNRGPLE